MSDAPDYDAGLLNDFGGGNVDWWQDYLRAEIGRANEHWREQSGDADAEIATLTAERDRLRADLAAAEARLAPIVALAERIRQIVRNSEDSPAPIYTWMLHEISEDMAAAILAAGGQP